MRHPHPVHLASAVPGLKTSAAFLSSLSANLRLPDDDLYPSPMSTPLMRGVAFDHIPLPPPSPLSAAMSLSREASEAAAAAAAAMSSRKGSRDSSKKVEEQIVPPPAVPDDLPTLSTYSATTHDEKVDALKLVTDSVAQQRQMASKAIIFHPASLAAYAVLVAVIVQIFYKTRADLPTTATTLAGFSVACLFVVRYFTDGYILAAESIKWDWLGDDQVIVTKWGEDIIGALVLGWAKEEGKGRRKKAIKGQIRAWTVKYKYRGRGVGTALLEEAVDAVSKRGGDGIEFAYDHANSTQILKPMFNAPFNRVEERAHSTLEKVVEEKGAFSRSRRQRTP